MVRLNRKKREQYKKIIVEAIKASEIQQFRDAFLELHPSDQVDIFVMLDEELRKRCYEYLDPSEFAMIFEGLDIYQQQQFFEELDMRYSSEMFNNMFTDDVVYFLTDIKEEQADEILNRMEQEKADKIRTLLAYEDETAGAIMTKEFISISAKEKATRVIEQLREKAPDAEIIYYNY